MNRRKSFALIALALGVIGASSIGATWAKPAQDKEKLYAPVICYVRPEVSQEIPFRIRVKLPPGLGELVLSDEVVTVKNAEGFSFHASVEGSTVVSSLHSEEIKHFRLMVYCDQVPPDYDWRVNAKIQSQAKANAKARDKGKDKDKKGRRGLPVVIDDEVTLAFNLDDPTYSQLIIPIALIPMESDE